MTRKQKRREWNNKQVTPSPKKSIKPMEQHTKHNKTLTKTWGETEALQDETKRNQKGGHNRKNKEEQT